MSFASKYFDVKVEMDKNVVKNVTLDIKKGTLLTTELCMMKPILGLEYYETILKGYIGQTMNGTVSDGIHGALVSMDGFFDRFGTKGVVPDADELFRAKAVEVESSTNGNSDLVPGGK